MKSLISTFLIVACSFSAQAAKPGTMKAAGEIDALLAADWARQNLQGNPPAPDEVFLRRIYLDVAGRIPTNRESGQFLESKDPGKREKLIDKLLASEGYAQNFFNYWADILRAQSAGQLGEVTGVAYLAYISEALATNKPYDVFVRELVSAQGKAWENGAIGYYIRDRGMPLDNMANTVRIFLGTRVECAQCHNHPFDRWTQKQFYEMAAFTYPLETSDYNAGGLLGAREILRKREQAIREVARAHGKEAAEKAREEFRKESRHITDALAFVRDPVRYTSVTVASRRDLRLPHDYQYPDMKPRATVKPATMMGKSVETPGKDERPSVEDYAAWMTSRDNPRFTKVIANRLWKKVFGMGLIEPVDEFMDNTVAVNPELMSHLETLMISLDYDMKAFLRVLFNTQAYQRSVSREEVPPGVEYHFTGPLLRRMTAEQMWDSFVALINPTPDMPNIPVREQAENRVLAARKFGDALDLLTPEEMLTGAEKAAVRLREQSAVLIDLQKRIAEARANDDKEKVRELGRKSSEIQRLARRGVTEYIVTPAMHKLAAKVAETSGGEAAASSGSAAGDAAPVVAENSMAGMTMNPMEARMGVDTKILIPGYDPTAQTDEELRKQREEQQKVLLEEAAYYGIPEKSLRDYMKYRASQARTWLRASEIGSPAPRGHALREFGQSDRETIENGNLDASVPQALAMMNSQLLPQIMHNYSQLMLTINKAMYPDDKVEAAYMTLLSRKPTAREREAWNKAQEKGLTTMEDLVYALINTQQFIFIQ